jgi:hypothetical protein
MDAAQGYVAICFVLDVCLQIRAVRFVFAAQHGEEKELLKVGQVGVIRHNWLAGLMWRSSDIYQI